MRIYTRSGALLTEFEPKNELKSLLAPTSLAVAPDGTLYVNNFNNPVFKFTPSTFPVKASTTYDAGKQMDGNTSFAVAVDSKSGHVYIGQTVAGQRRVGVYDDGGVPSDRWGVPARKANCKVRRWVWRLTELENEPM